MPRQASEELGYCDRCEYEFETNREINRYEGDQYCDDCYSDVIHEAEYEAENDSNSSGIHGYSYKPETIFHHSDGNARLTHQKTNNIYEPMMGIELETELVDENYLSHAANYINNTADGLVYLKEDCSINHGFEIVSHPMTLNYLQNHAQRYKTCLDYLRKNGYRAWGTSTCGLHIHISKNAFTDTKHEAKFLYFIFKNKKTLVKFAGRQSGYAKFDLDSFVGAPTHLDIANKPTVLEVVKGVRKNGEYVPGQFERNLAVNRSNYNTHELRIFRPSLRFTTVLAYAEFVHCLFSYSQQVTAAEAIKNNALTSFAPLLKFAEAQDNLYQNFITRANSRNVLQAETDNK